MKKNKKAAVKFEPLTYSIPVRSVATALLRLLWFNHIHIGIKEHSYVISAKSESHITRPPLVREANNQYFPIDQLESQTRGTWPSYILGLCFILTIILVATQWKKFRQLKLACQKKSDTNIQSPGPEADPPKPRSRIFEA
ncbi:hypothetical protein ABEB36_000023 [Hypothenemus hampei]|uniref:Uncharacterized protein n=1 Tax=Hypothenemus hampei TaxID=57062 RepID=A0ABD1FCN1_HYPHA